MGVVEGCRAASRVVPQNQVLSKKNDLLTRLIKAELSQSLIPHPARLASLVELKQAIKYINHVYY
jgi:hypothetical protein